MDNNKEQGHLLIRLFQKQVDETFDVPAYQAKLRFLLIGTIVGVMASLSYAVWEWWRSNYVHMSIHLMFPVMVPPLIYVLYNRPHAYNTILKLLAVSIFLAVSMAVIFPGGIYYLIWFPVYPVIFFFILGYKGWPWALALFLEILLLYGFHPDYSGYKGIPFSTVVSIMVAYLVVSLLSWINGRELQFYRSTISRRAHYDFLTGVNNRIAWMDQARQEMHSVIRNGARKLSVILLDVDDFKRVNDQFGHHVGDEVLKLVARQLDRRLRGSDVLGRWGGEEFVILLPDADLQQAIGVAEELRQNLMQSQGEGHSVTASFGVTEYISGESLEEMMIRIDKHLYRAKSEGKNRVVSKL